MSTPKLFCRFTSLYIRVDVLIFPNFMSLAFMSHEGIKKIILNMIFLKQFGVGPFESICAHRANYKFHIIYALCGTRLIYNQMECNDVKGRGWSELTQGLNMSFMCQSVPSHFSGVNR